MKKFMTIVTTMMILLSFSTIGNTAIIEMYFEDIEGRQQSLEFDDTINYKDEFDVRFGETRIFNEGMLFELDMPDIRNTSSEYNMGTFSFHDDCDKEVLEFSYATIFSNSIDNIGYATTADIIPGSLESILDDMVGVDGFFFYMFNSSEASGLGDWDGDTTLTSWNYQSSGSPVPVPPTILLFGSGLIGLISISRRKKL